MNSTTDIMDGTGGDGDRWNSSPAWKLPGWAEPVMVAIILFLACFLTRRASVSLFASKTKQTYPMNRRPPPRRNTLSPLSVQEGEHLLSDDEVDAGYVYSSSNTSRTPSPAFGIPTTITSPFPPSSLLPIRRTIFGHTIHNPNTTRFRYNWHSRVLYKFPFLIEMFYWILTYAIYQMSRIAGQQLFQEGIWERAQANGEKVLWVEHGDSSWLSWVFLLKEIDVQKWFMSGTWGLTVLNRCYALIHIPGTVGFIAWYYASAPTHSLFATVRRTMTLCNWLAFLIFSAYPCMPPRLLPEEYGFVDTVRRDNAQSVWMRGKFVNSLAAMPSMHFGYAFIIGLVLVMHSSVLRGLGRVSAVKRGAEIGREGDMEEEGIKEIESTIGEEEVECEEFDGGRREGLRIGNVLLALGGVAYPTLILTAIVATANHYWLDAVVGAILAGLAYWWNRVFLIFLPLEDWFMWLLRVENPVPTCGRGKRLRR